MIEDLPKPEPSVTPANTKVKTEFITQEFSDDGTVSVTFGTVKGFIDAKGVLQKDERTREKASADGLALTPDMGPKEIIKAARAKIDASLSKANPKEDAILTENPLKER